VYLRITAELSQYQKFIKKPYQRGRKIGQTGVLERLPASERASP
jgi:hypothetical protein